MANKNLKKHSFIFNDFKYRVKLRKYMRSGKMDLKEIKSWIKIGAGY